MFHFLAMFTFGALITFIIAGEVAIKFGFIERKMVSWSKRGDETSQQLIHTFFAVCVIVLALVTFLFAPVKNFVWGLILAITILNHFRFSPPFTLPGWLMRLKMVLGWLATFIEVVYLGYLAFRF